MSKFKVGDKVRCIKDNWSFIEKSKEYSIEGIEGAQVVLNNSKGYPEEDFVLVETVETFPFKVGDKVITHNPAIISEDFKGKVGTVIESVGTDKGIIRIDYGEYRQYGSIIEDSLELYLEPNEDKPSQTTGGPSSYYDFDPGWLTWNDVADYKAKTQWKEYSFHLGNIGKAIFRWGDKSGTSKVYDAEKIVYSALRVLMMLSGPKRVQEYLKTLQDDPQFKVGDTK